MDDRQPRAPRPEPRSTLARTLAVYSAELTAGVAAGVAFFLLTLWLLNVAFPDATGLGEFARGGSGDRDSATLFVDGPGAIVARLEAVRGDVRDKPDSSVSWSQAGEGANLGDRHAVQSYDDSGATIVFDETNRLELGEKSVIVVRRPRRVEGSFRRRASVVFMDGFLRGRLGGADAGGMAVEVVAAGGVVRPSDADTGAEIALAVDSSTSSLTVREGSVEIAWGDEVTTVNEGQMVTYDETGAPSAPVLMPGEPSLVAPADAERYAYRATPPEVRLAWDAPRADTVRVQIARDRDFEAVVLDERRRGGSFVHGNLEAGEYWWRVVPYRMSLEGPTSVARRLEIVRDGEPPALEVEFPDGTVRESRFLLRGRSEPGSRIVIGPVTLHADASGGFEHLLTLRDGYNFVVVQSIDAAGNTAFANHAIIAELPESGRTP